MNVTALRAALARPTPPPVEPYGPADELRRQLVPAWDHRRAVELGESSAYASSGSTRALARGAGTLAGAAARCGDCRAIRSPLASEPCSSCGSTQPPDLSAMNPRAARMIGASPYR